MTLSDIQRAPAAGDRPHTSTLLGPRQGSAGKNAESECGLASPAAGAVDSSTVSNADDMASRIAMVQRLRAAQQKAKKSSKKPVPLENEIQRAVMNRLKELPYVRVERNNRGSKGHVRFGLGEGAADLVGLVLMRNKRCLEDPDWGRFFALEIKRPGKKPEPHQEAWAESVRALGGYVGCATSVDEALACVEEARDVSKVGRLDRRSQCVEGDLW